jgi:tellurite resistance protein
MGILSAIGRGLFGESTESKATRIASEDPFRIKLVKEEITLKDGAKIEVLSVKLRGIINSGQNAFPADKANLTVMLSTEGPDGREPIICAIESLQSEKSPVFCHTSDSLDVTYGLCGGWDGWVNLVSVPLMALTFSRKGQLEITAKIFVAYTLLPRGVVREDTLGYYNNNSGFIDSMEQRKRGREVAVSLAVLVAGIDGVRDETEAEIVTGFIRKQITSIEDESAQAVAKQKLNKAVKEAHAIRSHAAIRRRGFEFADEAAEFDSDIKFQIMELLLDVAGADDVAAKHETDFLNDLAHRMGLDLDEYKNMRDKALPISIYETSSDDGGGQVEGMLGITDGMSVAEKKSQLSKEYRKWNALKNSSDPVKSKQAKDMVKAIGELRKSL